MVTTIMYMSLSQLGIIPFTYDSCPCEFRRIGKFQKDTCPVYSYHTSSYDKLFFSFNHCDIIAIGYGERDTHTQERERERERERAIQFYPRYLVFHQHVIVSWQSFNSFYYILLSHLDTDITGKCSHHRIDPIVDPLLHNSYDHGSLEQVQSKFEGCVHCNQIWPMFLGPYNVPDEALLVF